MNPLPTILITTILAMAAAHSQVTDPQSTAPMTCRLGGEPRFGVDNCAGPCDMRAIRGGYANHGSPSNPARVYRRGQRITVKYQRNNHAPGGFTRITLVKPEKMMDKREHEKNAIYYSCWGANAVKAAPNELKKGRFGYSMVGSDGEQHSLAKGYYTTTLTIPKVVPDGNYIMGWVWYGGTGGGVVENNGRATKKPAPYGYFSDYWSCSYVKIQGGAPLAASYRPVFNNDMSQFSREGCMSANDSPGVCSREPCKVTGRFQKPRQFKNGRTPRALTPRDFGGSIPKGSGSGRSQPRSSGDSELTKVRKRSCRCLGRGNKCPRKLVSKTRNYCKTGVRATSQPSRCKQACCAFCRQRRGSSVCRSREVKTVCKL